MNRYKIIFSYKGTDFYGYAKQPNKNTIQQEVETVLSKILNEEITIYASGRTDRGVHALNQVAHFDTEKDISNLDKFVLSINKLINRDIHFKSIEKVTSEFHARFSATGKKYDYVINLGEYTPFFKDLEENITNLNVDKMIMASRYFIGKKSFQNYTSKPDDESNFIREIFSIDFKRINNRLIISFYGNGFMKYEIRKIVGTLIEVGKDKISLEYIINSFNGENRQIVSYQASSRGLYLKEVIY